MYAVIDIESTGGKYNEEGITEIAIYKFDGHQIVDTFTSLLNPERKIQAFVVKLTGITQEMLLDAPKFYEVANRIIKITNQCILVAHNASFDYRILRTEFSRLGYQYKRHTLCTVELSKKLLPNESSYKLSTLTKSLGISLLNKHRASADALATVELLKILLDKDKKKQVFKTFLHTQPIIQLDTKLSTLLEKTPNAVGVYLFYDKKNKPIYVGKSKNIYKTVNQHFTKSNPKSITLQNHVYDVKNEVTGNELMAILRENELIKSLQPKYNKAISKKKYTHILTTERDDKGYIIFLIKKMNNCHNYLSAFTSLMNAKKYVKHGIEKYNLCIQKTSLQTINKECYNFEIKKCHGACLHIETAKSYNKRAKQLIESLNFTTKNKLIVGKGREDEEKSVVFIKEGEVYGYGYYNINAQITNLNTIERIIKPIKYKGDAKHIVKAFMHEHSSMYNVIDL